MVEVPKSLVAEMMAAYTKIGVHSGHCMAGIGERVVAAAAAAADSTMAAEHTVASSTVAVEQPTARESGGK